MQRNRGINEPPEEERPMLGPRPNRLRTRMRYTRYKRPPPPKTTLAAATMLVIGVVLALLGFWHMWRGDKNRGGPHILLGGILLLPGSYASLNLLGAYLGWSGYDYSSVPSYDD